MAMHLCNAICPKWSNDAHHCFVQAYILVWANFHLPPIFSLNHTYLGDHTYVHYKNYMNICILPCAPSYIVNLPLLTWVSTTSYSDIVLISRFTLSRAVRLGKSYMQTHMTHTHTHIQMFINGTHIFLACTCTYINVHPKGTAVLYLPYTGSEEALQLPYLPVALISPLGLSPTFPRAPQEQKLQSGPRSTHTRRRPGSSAGLPATEPIAGPLSQHGKSFSSSSACTQLPVYDMGLCRKSNKFCGQFFLGFWW